MYWLLGLAILAFYGLAIYAGRRIGLASKTAGHWVAGACVLMIMVNLFFYYNPQREYDVISFHFYIYLRPWWMPVFAFGLLGCALGILPEKRKRIAVKFLAGTIMVFYVFRLSATAAFNPDSLTGAPKPLTGECFQTTGYSCGAASAAMLLWRVHVPATEREMAVLCGTNAMNGTDVLGVMWGLREKLKGTPYRLKLVTGDWNTLAGLKLPAMATMHLSMFVDHWVVVLHADNTGVLVADPVRGIALRPRQEFMDSWKNLLVELVDERDAK